MGKRKRSSSDPKVINKSPQSKKVATNKNFEEKKKESVKNTIGTKTENKQKENQQPEINQEKNDNIINSLEESVKSLQNQNQSILERIEAANKLLETTAHREWISKEKIISQIFQWINTEITVSYSKKSQAPNGSYLQNETWKLLIRLIKIKIEQTKNENFTENLNQSNTQCSVKILPPLTEWVTHRDVSSKNESNIQIISEVCSILFENQCFRPAISIDQFTNFIVAIFTDISQDKNKKNNENYYIFLTKIVNIFNNYLLQQVNFKKIFLNFIEKLVPHFLPIRYDLQKKLRKMKKNTKKIHSEKRKKLSEFKKSIDRLITTNLFQLTDCHLYFLAKEATLEKGAVIIYHHNLFQYLQENSNSPFVSSFFPFLFKNFIHFLRKQILEKQTKENENQEKHEITFFANLIKIITAKLADKSKKSKDNSLENSLFETMIKLFSLITKFQINIPPGDEIHTQFDSFTNLLIKSMKTTPKGTGGTDVQWKTLTEITKIKYKNVLENLKDLFQLFFHSPEVSNQKIEFLISVMHLFSKLRQTSEFLSLFIESLNEIQNTSIFQLFYANTRFWNEFGEFIKLIPTQYQIDHWNIFLFPLKTYLDSFLHKQSKQSPQKKEIEIEKFKFLSLFFQIFIDNIQINENNAPEILKYIETTYNEFLLEIFQEFGKINFQKIQENEKKQLFFSSMFIFPSLKILYHHSESLLFKSYENDILQKGFSLPPNFFQLFSENLKLFNFSDLFSIFKNKKNESSVEGKGFDEKQLIYSISYCCYQRIYELHSCSVSKNREIRNEIQILTEFVFKEFFNEFTNISQQKDWHTFVEKQEWNENIYMIQSNNLLLSLFSLFSENLFFISNYIPAEHIKKLLEFIFSPFLLKSTFHPSESQAGTKEKINFNFLIKNLLTHDQFYELHSVRDESIKSLEFLITTELIKIIPFYSGIKTDKSKSKSPKKDDKNTPGQEITEIVNKLIDFPVVENEKKLRKLQRKIIRTFDRNANIFKKLVEFENEKSKNYLAKDKIQESVEDLYYLFSLINSFPALYFSLDHWKIIFIFIFFIEKYFIEFNFPFEKLNQHNSIKIKELLFEFRHSLSKSIESNLFFIEFNKHNYKKKSFDINDIFSDLLITSPEDFIVQHVVYFLHSLFHDNSTIFLHFTKNYFSGLTKSELIKYFKSTSNHAEEILKLDDIQSINTLKSVPNSYKIIELIKTTDDPLVIDISFCYLIEFLKQMINKFLKKENQSRQFQREFRTQKRIRKIQDDESAMVEQYTQERDNQKTDQSDDEDEKSESDDDMETDTKIDQSEKSVETSKTLSAKERRQKFTLPNWQNIEKILYSAIIVEKKEKIFKSSEDSLTYVNRIFEYFSYLLNFNKFWYSTLLKIKNKNQIATLNPSLKIFLFSFHLLSNEIEEIKLFNTLEEIEKLDFLPELTKPEEKFYSNLKIHWEKSKKIISENSEKKKELKKNCLLLLAASCSSLQSKNFKKLPDDVFSKIFKFLIEILAKENANAENYLNFNFNLFFNEFEASHGQNQDANYVFDDFFSKCDKISENILHIFSILVKYSSIRQLNLIIQNIFLLFSSSTFPLPQFAILFTFLLLSKTTS